MANLQSPPKAKKRRRVPIVGAVMTSFPYFVDVDDTAATLEQMMDEHEIRHLPVQQNGRVVGIVSERDLHHRVNREAPKSEKDKIHARHIMVPDPYIVSFRTPLSEVVFEMARRRIGSVLVQRQGKLAGILSAMDVCRIFGEYLESMFPGGKRGGGDTAA
jgi:acetoin utilization protein AcuB